MKTKRIKKRELTGVKILLRLFVCCLLFGGLVLLFNSMKIDCNINPPMESYCLTYNIEELDNCIREGYTGKGFLGMSDLRTEYWVCEDYGRIALRCVAWSEPGPSNWTADWEHCK